MSHDPLRRAITQLARFPGIGERSATRLAYWLLRQPPDTADDIARALHELVHGLVRCKTCCNIAAQDPCALCTDTRRQDDLVCVVERPQDILAIDASGEFRGRYHVLHGAISPLDGVGPKDLHIQELLTRLETGGIHEVLIATDPDVEGDATALYLAQLLKPLGVKVSRLAHGVSVGTELEYADRSSVARAIENRRVMG